jgi:altronate dehydratase
VAERTATPGALEVAEPVRRHRAAISTVSCANVVTESLGERDPELAVLTHQHGCGQLGDDTALTRGILAGLASHPNVAACVFVSLGCETNAVGPLLEAARRRGGNVGTAGIQASGGVEAATDRAAEFLAAAAPPAARPLGPAVIGVVADDGALATAGPLVEAVVEALAGAGAAVLVPSALVPPARQPASSSGPLGVPVLWGSQPRSETPVIGSLASAPSAPGVTRVELGGDLVERMTVLTAIGAHALVSVVARPSLVGAALAPTICVAADPALDALEDLVDVPFGPPRLPERVLDEVGAVLAGRRTRAERLGMRDLALPRLGPCY